jgi:hypothetical protein
MFELVARQSAKYADSLEKNAVMAELFNKSGREMNKLVAEIAEAGQLNATVTEKQADEAKRLNDQLLVLKMSSEQLWRGLAADFVPTLNAIVKAFIDAKREGGLLNGVIGALSEGFTKLQGDDLQSQLKAVNAEIENAAKAIINLKENGRTFLGIEKTGMIAQAESLNGLLEKRANILALLATKEAKVVEAAKGPPDYDPVAQAAALAAARKAEADALLKAKQLLEDYVKAAEAAAAIDRETAKEIAGLDKNRTDAILATEKSIDQLTFETSLMGKSNLERERAIALRQLELAGIKEGTQGYEGLRERMLAAVDAQEAMRLKQEQIRSQVSVWTQLADAAGNFFSDLVQHGRSAFDNLSKMVKQLLADMIGLFAKRWILQIVASLTGSTALSAAAGQAGQGTVAGALGNWLGSTAVGAYLGGAFEGFQMGLMSGMASPAAGVMEQFGAAVNGAAGALGIFAAVVAGMIANDHMFQSGWRADNQNYHNFGYNFATGGTAHVDSILRGLGFSDRAASLLSGSSLAARIWGMGAQHADAYGVMGTINGQSLTGQTWQDYSRRGGLFRSDQRWTDTADLSSGQSEFLNHFMSGLAEVTAPLSRLLGVNAATSLAGYSRDFNFQLSDNGNPLSQEQLSKLFGDLMGTVLQEQVATLLDAGGQGKLAEYIRGLKEEGDALTAKVIELVNVMGGLKQLNLKGLDASALMAWQQGTETLGQAFDRVAGQITSFDDAFMTADQKLERSQRQVISTFSDLGIAIPENTQAFYDLVHGLDLGTEAGRNMFDALMAVAPAFLTVQSAAETMMKGFDDLMGRIRPGYTAQMLGLTLTSDLSQFRGGNAWAAGLGDSELIAQLRTITRDDFSHYDPKWQALILGILGIDSTMNDVKDATVELGQTMSGSRPWDDTFHQYYQSRQARESLGQSLEGSLLGPQSPLDPMEQLREAQKQFEAILALAQGGDVDAIGKLGGARSAYLEIARQVYGSGAGYADIFNRTFDQAAPIAEIASINQRMLDVQTKQADILGDVLNILMQIRDRGDDNAEGQLDVAVAAADKVSLAIANAALATARR